MEYGGRILSLQRSERENLNCKWPIEILNNRDSYSYGTKLRKSSALFGQSTWHATPKLDITTGARVTYEDKSASIYRTDPIGGTPVSG